MVNKHALRKSPHSDGGPLKGKLTSQFKVVMLFEDFSTGVHAKATMDRVIENLETHFPFETKFWRFDLLEILHFMEMAAKDAADADMVIISAHGGPEIPESIKNWVPLWLNQRLGGECALIELLDSRGDSSGPWPIHGFLESVARKAGLDFFSHIIGPRKNEPLFQSTRQTQQVESRGFA